MFVHSCLSTRLFLFSLHLSLSRPLIPITNRQLNCMLDKGHMRLAARPCNASTRKHMRSCSDTCGTYSGVHHRPTYIACMQTSTTRRCGSASTGCSTRENFFLTHPSFASSLSFHLSFSWSFLASLSVSSLGLVGSSLPSEFGCEAFSHFLCMHAGVVDFSSTPVWALLITRRPQVSALCLRSVECTCYVFMTVHLYTFPGASRTLAPFTDTRLYVYRPEPSCMYTRAYLYIAMRVLRACMPVRCTCAVYTDSHTHCIESVGHYTWVCGSNACASYFLSRLLSARCLFSVALSAILASKVFEWTSSGILPQANGHHEQSRERSRSVSQSVRLSLRLSLGSPSP